MSLSPMYYNYQKSQMDPREARIVLYTKVYAQFDKLAMAVGFKYSTDDNRQLITFSVYLSRKS